MKSLKSIVQRRLLLLTVIMMAAILLIALCFQIISTQMAARENADAMFAQIQQILRENSTQLAEVESAYRTTCLTNADAISHFIKNSPELLDTQIWPGETLPTGTAENIERFRELARKLEVDEIHIFDAEGRIFTGTHREYFNYTFDSGEQIGFFKPLLQDKTLRLCQDITPNTAAEKLVQYSAMWSSDGQYIVQVGMYPDAILKVTEKNELSYIFSLLKGNKGVALYAIKERDGQIVGSTVSDDNGKNIVDIGLPLVERNSYEKGTHRKVNGTPSYCMMANVDGTLILYVISNDQLYSNIGSYTLLLLACLAVIAVVLVLTVTKYTDRYIIGSISATNERLRAVTAGNLDERADVQSSQEFSELTSHINSMIRSLLADTEKMNLVLNRTNLHIGVYEYSIGMKKVRFTEHIPEIFGLSAEDTSRLFDDQKQLQAFIDNLRSDPAPFAENTYRFVGKSEMYIKLEEITSDFTVLGVVMDVTEETLARMRAEAERDMDLMTGLYNRRGMERQLNQLFHETNDIGFGALIMIDSDNLKHINDTYGHAVGDTYLKRLADVLRHFDAPRQLAARTGGDEFVLLIYGYDSNAAVSKALEKIRALQLNATVTLENGKTSPLHFSYGFEMIHGRRDYEAMLSAADVHMYNSKRARKKAFRDQQAARQEERTNNS